MINVNAVLILNGKAIVPVRAVPFVTGGDIGPRCLASLLSESDQCFWAYVLGADGTVATLLPKNWRNYRARLSASGTNTPDLIDRATLEILPSSTFVYWESLWRNHEANFLPPRDAISDCSTAEQGNYELQPNASIPKGLIELVFEGFQVTGDARAQPAADATSGRPTVEPVANGVGMSVSLNTESFEPCLPAWSLNKPQRRDALTNVLVSELAVMLAKRAARPRARDVLDAWTIKRPPDVLEVLGDGLKYLKETGNAGTVSLGALQKRLNNLIC